MIVERKEIAAICARARNEYARVEIKKDFKAGLRVGLLLSYLLMMQE